MSNEGSLSPESVLSQLKSNNITHVVWLPDSETNWLYLLMKNEPSIELVPVSREGQAFSVAAGLATGGKKPVILIQNTGLLESGDSLRGWCIGLKTPVVMLIGYRGWTRHGKNAFHDVAKFTEPFLIAMGINYYLVENDGDIDRITYAFEEADENKKPVAVLVGDEYSSWN